ncbi:MAG: response regulator [Ktedonobacterales bacterium]
MPQRDGETGDVLVIDDDPGIVDLLISLLRDEEGYTVRAAHSVSQALACPAPAPALILLDLSLPGENAGDSVRALRALPGWDASSLVLCSGRDDLDTARRELGAAEYLRKPFDLDTVAEVAWRFVGRRKE